MKGRFSVLSGLIICFWSVLISCGDEPAGEKKESLEIETTASAKVEDDHQASGVYKGTFVGSSGTFKLIIQLDMVGGILVVDGFKYLLATDDIDITAMESGIENALFTDRNDRVKLWFSVEANGENPSVELEVEGHDNIEVVILKETSASHVKVYEGFRYCSYPLEGIQVKGNLNIVLDVDSLISIAYKTDSSIPIPNGQTGTIPEESWITIGKYYYQENYVVLQSYEPLRGIICSGDSFFAITEDEVYKKFEWIYEGFTYTDSVRLIRKL